MELYFHSPFENQGTITGRSITAHQTSNCGTVTVTADGGGDGDGGGDNDDNNDGTQPPQEGSMIPGGSTAVLGGVALVLLVAALSVV